MFEYPIAFFIIPIFYLCKKFCKLKKDSLIFPNSSKLKSIKNFNILEFLILLLLTIALASPISSKIIKDSSKGYDIVTILDTSGSMAQMNKLDIAKSIILNFAKKRKNDRLALVIFGNIAYIASPLTYNKKNFKEILDRIYPNIAGGRTALIDALFLSTTLFKNSKSKNKIIILVTDGKDNISITPLDVTIKKLKKEKIRVYSIGIGFDVDKNLLENISKKTNGKYFFIKNPKELQKVFNTIDKLEKSNIEKITIINTYYFQYPLFLALILMVIYIYKSRRLNWNF